jgi:hypothetical protein
MLDPTAENAQSLGGLTRCRGVWSHPDDLTGHTGDEFARRTNVRYSARVEPTPPLQAHEIEVLRRSLAIGNGLPSDQIRRLLTTCDELFKRSAAAPRDPDTTGPETADPRTDDQRTTDPGTAERIRAELEALRPVVAELRTRLTSLHDLAAAPTRDPGEPGGPGGSGGCGRSFRGR